MRFLPPAAASPKSKVCHWGLGDQSSIDYYIYQSSSWVCSIWFPVLLVWYRMKEWKKNERTVGRRTLFIQRWLHRTTEVRWDSHCLLVGESPGSKLFKGTILVRHLKHIHFVWIVSSPKKEIFRDRGAIEKGVLYKHCYLRILAKINHFFQCPSKSWLCYFEKEDRLKTTDSW